MNVLSTMIMITPVLFMVNLSSWLMIWAMMELNTLGFLYWISEKMKMKNLMMFFIFQSMASCLVLIVIMANNTKTMGQNISSEGLFYMAMAVKIGIFPFQLWATEMSKTISWSNNTILMTWQKTTPIIFLVKNSTQMWAMVGFMGCLFMMSTMIMSCSTIKPMMMLSSLIHTVWIVIPSPISKSLPFFYLIIYSIMVVMAVKKMKESKSTELPIKSNLSKKIWFSVTMMSMGGIPPLMGFIPKWTSIFLMVKMKMNNVLTVFVTLMATISFFIYSKTALMVNSMTKENSKKSAQLKLPMNYMVWVNMTLPLMVVMF